MGRTRWHWSVMVFLAVTGCARQSGERKRFSLLDLFFPDQSSTMDWPKNQEPSELLKQGYGFRWDREKDKK